MEHLGVVGLADSGHAQLFTALTGIDAQHASDRLLGVVHLPDERLDALAEMSESKKVVPGDVPDRLPARAVDRAREGASAAGCSARCATATR